MVREPTYQAARAVAAVVEEHFARHVAEARRRDEQELAHTPDARAIETIIDATFWASFRPEEGRFPKISLAFLPPEQAGHPLKFEDRLPLTPAILTKLAPAVERPGIHLGVWHDAGKLYVWGATRQIPSLGFVLEDVEPGLLVIKHRRIDGFGKFANVAILKGEQTKIVDEQGTSLPDCPDLLKSLLAFTSPSTWDDSVNVLVQLAASMRAHGHGGSLLVVPRNTNLWLNSIVQPITYALIPPFPDIATFLQNKQLNGEASLITLQTAADALAGLTAVDGATVISDQFEPLAFGAKILTRDGVHRVDQILLTEPIEGVPDRTVDPAHLGGTRHLSAAQFAHDQRNATALVASQDGQFTVFAWSSVKNMVHAHRLDALLI